MYWKLNKHLVSRRCPESMLPEWDVSSSSSHQSRCAAGQSSATWSEVDDVQQEANAYPPSFFYKWTRCIINLNLFEQYIHYMIYGDYFLQLICCSFKFKMNVCLINSFSRMDYEEGCLLYRYCCIVIFLLTNSWKIMF